MNVNKSTSQLFLRYVIGEIKKKSQKIFIVQKL